MSFFFPASDCDPMQNMSQLYTKLLKWIQLSRKSDHWDSLSIFTSLLKCATPVYFAITTLHGCIVGNILSFTRVSATHFDPDKTRKLNRFGDKMANQSHVGAALRVKDISVWIYLANTPVLTSFTCIGIKTHISPTICMWFASDCCSHTSLCLGFSGETQGGLSSVCLCVCLTNKAARKCSSSRSWGVSVVFILSGFCQVTWVRMNFIWVSYVDSQTQMCSDTFNISHIITVYSL